jgi:hypothetical protein
LGKFCFRSKKNNQKKVGKNFKKIWAEKKLRIQDYMKLRPNNPLIIGLKFICNSKFFFGAIFPRLVSFPFG